MKMQKSLFCAVCYKKGKMTKLKKYEVNTKEFGKDIFFFCPLCNEDRWLCDTINKVPKVKKK